MSGSRGRFSRRGRERQRWVVCAAAIAAAITACGAPSRVRDDIHRDEWYELRSQHIRLTTDLPIDRAQEHIRDLEQSWRALNAMYGVIAPWATPPDEPFPVIHLSSCFDYQDIAPKNSVGFMSSQILGDDNVVVTCELPTRNHSVLVHELTHILNHRCIPLAPPWVDEGLAMYFETMVAVDGRVIIGKLPRGYEHLWRVSAWLPKLPEVLGSDRAAFRDDHGSRVYFAAWKLVHLLNNTTPDYRNRLRGYLAMLHGDHDRKDAWEQAFYGIPPERIAQEYSSYHQRSELRLWTTSYELEDAPDASVRQLRAGEAHVVWVRLLSRHSPEEALRQLDLAAHADPDWPDVLYWRALLLPWLRRPRGDEQAAAALREYRSRRPDDVRGWHLFLSRELSRVVPADHLGLEDTAPIGIAELEPIAKGLVARGQQPSDLDLVAWYYAMARRADTGLPLAIESVQRDPGCADCWDTLALLYFQKGDAARALLAQERAVNMYGDGRILPGVRARLQRYRAATSSAPAAPAAPAAPVAPAAPDAPAAPVAPPAPSPSTTPTARSASAAPVAPPASAAPVDARVSAAPVAPAMPVAPAAPVDAP